MREDLTSIRVRKTTQELLNKAKGKLEYKSGQLYTLDTTLQQVLKEWLDIKPSIVDGGCKAFFEEENCEHPFLVSYHDNSLMCKVCHQVVWQGVSRIETPPKILQDKVVG